jgi:trigger factor
MQTTLENVEKHRVKLAVAVDPAEAGPFLDLAYRHVASSISVPGFRKGKIPRKIVDQQAGRGAVMQEFLEHALPELYLKAVREHELAPIGEPEFDDLDASDVEQKGFSFTAAVDVRPRVEFQESDYRGIRIEKPQPRVAEAEVDEQLDRLRDRFAELEEVGHPARRGDYVVADVRASRNEQEIPEATGTDLLYEVGSEGLVAKLDEELEGSRRGDILKFGATLPERFGEHGGQEASFQVLVKEVKSKRLPALDDGFARTSSEFDTLEELRSDVRAKLLSMKEAQGDAVLRDEALRVITAKVEDVELPEKLIDAETEARVKSATEQAERQGLTLQQVLEASDVEELQFRADARAHATRAVRADLALEAVARAEGLRVSDEELDRVIRGLSKDVGRSPKEIRRMLERSGQITSLAGDIIRDKALSLVIEHADVAGAGADEAESDTPPEEKDG